MALHKCPGGHGVQQPDLVNYAVVCRSWLQRLRYRDWGTAESSMTERAQKFLCPQCPKPGSAEGTLTSVLESSSSKKH